MVPRGTVRAGEGGGGAVGGAMTVGDRRAAERQYNAELLRGGTASGTRGEGGDTQ